MFGRMGHGALGGGMFLGCKWVKDGREDVSEGQDSSYVTFRVVWNEYCRLVVQCLVLGQVKSKIKVNLFSYFHFSQAKENSNKAQVLCLVVCVCVSGCFGCCGCV